MIPQFAAPPDYEVSATYCFTSGALAGRSAPANEHSGVNQTSALLDERSRRMFLHLEAAAEEALEYVKRPSERDRLVFAYQNACRLLVALPTSVPIPSMAFDPDLDVQLEWIVEPKHRVVVALDARNVLSFSAMYGGSTWFGNEDFVGTLPQVVWQALQRILRQSSKPESRR